MSKTKIVDKEVAEKARELRRLCDDVLNAQHQCQVEVDEKRARMKP